MEELEVEEMEEVEVVEVVEVVEEVKVTELAVNVLEPVVAADGAGQLQHGNCGGGQLAGKHVLPPAQVPSHRFVELFQEQDDVEVPVKVVLSLSGRN